jgi:hypothetical protein
MGQTHDENTQNPAERLCWEISRRDGCRLARRLYRKQLVEGVYRLDEGAALDDCFHFLQARSVTALLEQMHAAAIQRQMGLFIIELHQSWLTVSPAWRKNPRMRSGR